MKDTFPGMGFVLNNTVLIHTFIITGRLLLLLSYGIVPHKNEISET